MGAKYPLKADSKLSWKMNHTEGGRSKDLYKYVCYELLDNCSSLTCFSDEDSCSFSFLHYGEIWGLLGQRDSDEKRKTQWSQDPLQDITRYSQICKIFYDVAIGVRLYKIYEFLNIFLFLEKYLSKNSSIFWGTKAQEVQFTSFPFP